VTEGTISLRKPIPIIIVTWILSLLTTLAIVYFAPTAPIGTNQIADNAVITAKLVDGGVTSAKILDGTITASDLADGSISSVKITDSAVTTAKIADGVVTSDKIADGGVTTAKIADDAIVTIKLADGTVTSAKILDGTVTAADLASGAVVTIKIADGAVTTSKIADNAITYLKLAPSAIPHNATQSTTVVSMRSDEFVDMPGMSVDITVTRRSTLIMMFSTEAWTSGGNYLYARAMINATTQAYPTSDWMIMTNSSVPASYSITFYRENIVPGTYTIKIQWRVFSFLATGSAQERALVVFALPA